MTADDLRAFEARVQAVISAGHVRGPCHLSGGNEDQLIELFHSIDRQDWVFSTYRSHYHALLHGIPAEWLFAEILAGRSMSIHSQKYRFYTSAIVGGCLPIALGVAAGIDRRKNSQEHVWCFVGDMAASCGTFHDCLQYADRNDLPITFVVEDDGMSTYTPTQEAWGIPLHRIDHRHYYQYVRALPHIGAKAGVSF